MHRERVIELIEERRTVAKSDYSRLCRMFAQAWFEGEFETTGMRKILEADDDDTRSFYIQLLLNHFIGRDEGERVQDFLGEERFKRMSSGGMSVPLYEYDELLLEKFVAKYTDSEHFLPAGNYIITDPSYFLNEPDKEPVYNEENSLDSLGIKPSFMRPTVFGDWLCRLKDTETHEVIGHFSADAGTVVVAELDSVRAYAPEFCEQITGESERARFLAGCVTVLYGFEGTLSCHVPERPHREGADLWTCVDELVLSFDGRDIATGKECHLRSELA